MAFIRSLPSIALCISASVSAVALPRNADGNINDMVAGTRDVWALMTGQNFPIHGPGWDMCMADKRDWTNAKHRLVKREAFAKGGMRRPRSRSSPARGRRDKKDKGSELYPGAELRNGLPTHDKNGKRYPC